MIQQMIREEQHTSRELYIPQEDLSNEATTQLSPEAARVIDASPARGDVLLLPWETYRRPAWNRGEAVFDPWSLLLSRPVIWNDGTRVGDVELAPDDPRARRLDAAIRGGAPLTATLNAAGVSFVLDDADGHVGARLPGAVVLVNQPGLTVYQLPS